MHLHIHILSHECEQAYKANKQAKQTLWTERVDGQGKPKSYSIRNFTTGSFFTHYPWSSLFFFCLAPRGGKGKAYLLNVLPLRSQLMICGKGRVRRGCDIAMSRRFCPFFFFLFLCIIKDSSFCPSTGGCLIDKLKCFQCTRRVVSGNLEYLDERFQYRGHQQKPYTTLALCPVP